MDLARLGAPLGPTSAAAGGAAGSAAGPSLATASHLGLGGENGPIFYSEPNRTSAIDDIRSVVLHIFIVTIILSFFLIYPGIRDKKLPTLFCVTSSLLVLGVIAIALSGTTWHVAEAPISSAYKAFSRDRIQGELCVLIGLQSVNITLRAHKYYILHATHGPMIIESVAAAAAPREVSPPSARPQPERAPPEAADGPGSERELSSAADSADTADADESFALDADQAARRARSSRSNTTRSAANASLATAPDGLAKRRARAPTIISQQQQQQSPEGQAASPAPGLHQADTIKRVNVDINYNERFYWIEPNQMRQEHHNALERGLPFPILTVVEYLSQDDAGFSWSRQYRLAGYYSSILLWLALCTGVLMMVLHCAAPKYGIYAMQALGCLLLLTNFTYATLVPKGEQKLVIPFEGQSLEFRFGRNFWLVLIGGCISLVVGSFIVIIDILFPNFIFTTILDVDFDFHKPPAYYKHQPRAKLAPAFGGQLALDAALDSARRSRSSAPSECSSESEATAAAAADDSAPGLGQRWHSIVDADSTTTTTTTGQLSLLGGASAGRAADSGARQRRVSLKTTPAGKAAVSAGELLSASRLESSIVEMLGEQHHRTTTTPLDTK